MPDIRYICLSDMHLGDKASILSNLRQASDVLDTSGPSPVLIHFVECMRSLVKTNKDQTKKPTLVLNGDILELALTTPDKAAMVFEQFMNLAMKEGDPIFSSVVYVPGNHDHHLWLSARDAQYVNYIESIRAGDRLPTQWQATNMFMESAQRQVEISFLTKLVQRYGNMTGLQIAAAYPNFGITTKGGRKCVLFHHGHFIESIYKLISILKTMLFPDREMPYDVWDMEEENFAWIDFLWSALGQSGQAGQCVGLIYDKLHGKNMTPLKELLYNLADSIVDKYGLSIFGNHNNKKKDLLKEALAAAGKPVEAFALRGLFGLAADGIGGTEKARKASILSDDAQEGLAQYMSGPMRRQLMVESGQNMPEEVSFVFGHTHKPFESEMNFTGYPHWVKVYNTGGWVVESIKPQPFHGASMVVVDDELDVAAVRMYDEVPPAGSGEMVHEAVREAEAHSALYERLGQVVDRSREPWKSFSDAAVTAIGQRYRNLEITINSKT